MVAFRGSPTIGELARLSPASFFIRWSEAVHGEAGPPFDDQYDRRQVVGYVFEGPDRAHVLYRSTHQYPEARHIQRMPLNHSAGTWRMLLNDDIWSPSLLSLRLRHP